MHSRERLNRTTGEIVGAAIKVHRALGPGLLEKAYHACLAWELRSRNLRVDTQVTVPVVYHGIRVEIGYRLDIVVEQTVIVELKATAILLPIHEAQLLSYLKLTGYPVGLLINFHVPTLKEGIRRFVNNSR